MKYYTESGAKCRENCPIFFKADAYLAGHLELDLGVDRDSCKGPLTSAVGQLVCRAYVNRLDEYYKITKPGSFKLEEEI